MNFLLEFCFISTVRSLVILLWFNVLVAALGFTTCTVTYRNVPLVTQLQCDGSPVQQQASTPPRALESSGILLPSAHALNYTLFLLSTIIFLKNMLRVKSLLHLLAWLPFPAPFTPLC